MGTGYNHEIGHETLRKDFERYQKETPKGVSLQNKRDRTIVLKFKINGKGKSKGCNCTFTLDGMVDALRKAHLVAEALGSIKSETEFWQWYETEILDKNKIASDRLTFGEAIKKVEDDFWSRPDRRRQVRDKNNPSHIDSWYRTYGCFYKHLPSDKYVNPDDIAKVIDLQKRGTRNYKYAISAMKKLSRTIRRTDILDTLESLNIVQTENASLQTITIEDYLSWRNEILEQNTAKRKVGNITNRKAWLWVFSTQVVYGLRINEVFAIKNLFEPYKTEDGVIIPALNDPDNKDNLIYIGDKTNLGTTVKTGHRLARPQIPPKYPDLIERLDIKSPLIPINKPRSKDPGNIRRFHATTGRQRLIAWNAPITQTHALRHLANINGIQAGIPQEVRAQSMGHTPAMNDSVYKRRQSTQTKIDLLTQSNQNAIDFVTALSEAKKLVAEDENNREVIIRLLSIIYQKDSKAISELLN